MSSETGFSSPFIAGSSPNGFPRFPVPADLRFALLDDMIDKRMNLI
jgi:hypothetical protein